VRASLGVVFIGLGGDMAVFGASKKLIVRYAHRDSPCPSGFESGTFLHFDGHHGRGGYGAWIKEPEQLYDQAAESDCPNNSVRGVPVKSREK
jgi:hypothetical protein